MSNDYKSPNPFPDCNADLEFEQNPKPLSPLASKAKKGPADPRKCSSVVNDDPFYTTQEAADYLGCSKSYLDKLRVTGGGPMFIRFGRRKVAYRRSALDEWARNRQRGSTSEYGGQ